MRSEIGESDVMRAETCENVVRAEIDDSRDW